LIFECRYCGLEIALDDSSRSPRWHHQSTGDPACEPVSQAAS